MGCYHYQLADISFTIEGVHPIVDVLNKELGKLPKPSNKPEVLFQFEEKLPKINWIYKFENARIGPTCMYIKQSLFKYVILGKILEDDIILVKLVPEKSLHVQNVISLIKGWNFLSYLEFLAKDFIYGIFDYIMHLLLLRHNSAFIHASSVAKNKLVWMFVGLGGVGKSTLTSKFIYEYGWNYLADDLSIVKSNKQVFFNPKYIQIYPYNIKQAPILDNYLFKNASLLNKFHWKFYRWLRGVKGTRRRVSPEILYKNSTVEMGHLQKVFLLTLVTEGKVIITDLDPNETARRCSNIIIEELDPLSKHCYLAQSISKDFILPSVEEIKAMGQKVYSDVFSGVECYEIFIPEEINYNDLCKSLNKV